MNSKFINSIAISSAMIGSILVASNSPYSKYGYLFFITSSIASILLLRGLPAAKSLMFINVWFIGANVFGLARWFNFI